MPQPRLLRARADDATQRLKYTGLRVQPMGLPYSLFARPLLRFTDSETAHGLVMRGLSTFGQSRAGQRALSTIYHTPELPIHVFGRLFHHPLGLAAGYPGWVGCAGPAAEVPWDEEASRLRFR